MKNLGIQNHFPSLHIQSEQVQETGSWKNPHFLLLTTSQIAQESELTKSAAEMIVLAWERGNIGAAMNI